MTEIDSIVRESGIITGKKDFMNMPILGQVSDMRNVDLLQMDFYNEKKFNNPKFAYSRVLSNYKKSNKKFNLRPKEFLYEKDTELQFIDVDVFRQAALYFKKNGKYCPYDPEYDAAAHKLYWDIQEYRRKYGMTAYAGVDKNGERTLIHCPANYYGFLNFSIMNKVEDDDNSFDNSADFIDSDAEIEDLALIKLEELIEGLGVRTTKTAKKSIDFPNFFDAQYHLIVAKNVARLLGLNFFFVKARRKGCSYFNAWDQFNNIDMNPNISCILAAHDKKYLIHGKGLMKMVYTYSDFINKFTDWDKSRLVSNKEHLKFGFYPEGSHEEHGFLSEMLAVSAKNNPDVTIGKDIYEISFEEMGKFPNFEETENVTSSAAEAGEFKTGMITGWGTGGTDEANWEPFEKLCYNPRGRNVLACNNVWDEGQEGQASIFMYAHVDGLEGCMDYNGNTDYTLAWDSYKTKLEEKKSNTKDEVELEKWIGQRANSPSEAFARSGTNLFNRVRISYQLKKIESSPQLQYIYRHGVLIENSKGRVVLKTNAELKSENLETHPPIFNFPMRSGDDMYGCFVEFFPPYANPVTGQVPEGLYVAIQDPYAISKDKDNISYKDSLGVTYWYELPNNITPHRGGIMVASYIGRPPQTDDYNAQVLLGLKRYNSMLGFESNRGDTLRFMRMMKALHYLFKEPDLLTSKGVIKQGSNNYGIVINDVRKADGAKYLRDMLEMPLTRNSDGGLKTFIDYCYDTGFLKELLRWSLKGNFDRVSAWIAGMFFIKQLQASGHQPEDVKHITNSFFERELY